MANLNSKRSLGDILSGIGKEKSKKTKMNELAERSSAGEFSSYSAVFGKAELSSHERDKIESIFAQYSTSEESLPADLSKLIEITSEIKAINNQAILMHGERIKCAQMLLKKYRDGAFSEWLMTTYGNRQTPYNFLQYFEFHNALPKALHQKLDEMPRQAVYTLASREGDMATKEEIIRSYKGEGKQEVLSVIRESFPLPRGDKRAGDPVKSFMEQLSRIKSQMEKAHMNPTQQQKRAITKLLSEIKTFATKSNIEIDL